MDEAELVLLEQLCQSVFEEQFPEGQLSVAMLKSWHRRWLGNIYDVGGTRKSGQYQQGRLYVCPFSTMTKIAERVRHQVSCSLHAL